MHLASSLCIIVVAHIFIDSQWFADRELRIFCTLCATVFWEISHLLFVIAQTVQFSLLRMFVLIINELII